MLGRVHLAVEEDSWGRELRMGQIDQLYEEKWAWGTVRPRKVDSCFLRLWGKL